MMRWPLLPLGMMTDGVPYPEIAVEDGVPPEDEEAYRHIAEYTNSALARMR